MMRSAACLCVVSSLVVAALLPALAVAEGPDLDKEISFGVKMAQRGLWSEALFRFKKAAEQRPNDGKVLNNLAVSYEAVGQYDNALMAYKEALKVDPGNRELRRNYSRFIEFYQAFKPAGQQPPAEEKEAQQEAAEVDEPPSSQSGQ